MILRNRQVYSLIFFLLISAIANAQTDTTESETETEADDPVVMQPAKIKSPWKAEFMLTSNLAGVLVFNWVGTQPNKTFNATGRFRLSYAKKRNRFVSETLYSAAYTQEGDSDWNKNIDLFYTRNTYLYTLHNKWALAGVMDFTTQFFDGYLQKEVAGKEYRFKISSFLSPGFLTYGAGIAYVDQTFYAGVAPLAMSHYFIVDKEISPSLYGVEKDRFNEDFGVLCRAGYYNTFYKKKIFINLQTSLFKHYNGKYVYFAMNNMARMKLLPWLFLSGDASLLYNNQSGSLNLVYNISGIPTSLSTASPKLQTYISYGIGVTLVIPPPRKTEHVK